MSLKIQPGVYYAFLFYITLPKKFTKFKKGGNMMGMLERPADRPQAWKLTYRFRYYRDERIFEHNDKTTWYTAAIHGPQKKVEKKTLELVALLADVANGDEANIMRINGDHEKFMEIASGPNAPEWLHARQEPEAFAE